jgi:hypothetical protein
MWHTYLWRERGEKQETVSPSGKDVYVSIETRRNEPPRVGEKPLVSCWSSTPASWWTNGRPLRAPSSSVLRGLPFFLAAARWHSSWGSDSEEHGRAGARRPEGSRWRPAPRASASYAGRIGRRSYSRRQRRHRCPSIPRSPPSPAAAQWQPSSAPHWQRRGRLGGAHRDLAQRSTDGLEIACGPRAPGDGQRPRGQLGRGARARLHSVDGSSGGRSSLPESSPGEGAHEGLQLARELAGRSCAAAARRGASRRRADWWSDACFFFLNLRCVGL